MRQLDSTDLASTFERFARECSIQGSPLNSRLATIVAHHQELLDIAKHAPRDPIPNAMLGAVHFLLLDGTDHELANYYPSISANPVDDHGLTETFVSFCLTHQERIIEQLSQRMVQTNEVNRCAVLAPAFHLVNRLADQPVFAMIELGSSAGLNLLWDQYRYEYSDGTTFGDIASGVRLWCENRGHALPDVESRFAIGQRLGIDLNPIDIENSDARLWLRALVWPDQRERAERLDTAIELALNQDRTVVRGDVLDDLPDLLDMISPHLTVCVYQSSVLYQFSDPQLAEFRDLLEEASHARPIWHVSAESEAGLQVARYDRGRLVDHDHVADFDSHGRWLNWLANDGLADR